MFNPFAALRGTPQRNPDGTTKPDADGTTKPDAEGSMSLMEHLYELRRRLSIAALGLAVGAVVGFLWFSHDPFGLPSLGRILTAPYCDLPNDRRATLNGDPRTCTLLATGVFDAFFLQFKVGLAAGVVLSSPVWLGQLWGFITPGLYAKEKKYARIFVGSAAFLFTCGAVLAYFIVAQGLKVLLGFSSGVVSVALSPNDYFGFVVALLIIFGVSFELPLLVVMLNQVGVLPAANLKKWRRGIIMGLFVFAAFATPGTDVISMLALAVALVVLFEVAVLIASAHDRRKARTSADAQTFSDLDDDEPSPLDLSGGASDPGPSYEAARYEGTTEDPRSYTDAT